MEEDAYAIRPHHMRRDAERKHKKTKKGSLDSENAPIHLAYSSPLSGPISMNHPARLLFSLEQRNDASPAPQGPRVFQKDGGRAGELVATNSGFARKHARKHAHTRTSHVARHTTTTGYPISPVGSIGSIAAYEPRWEKIRDRRWVYIC